MVFQVPKVEHCNNLVKEFIMVNKQHEHTFLMMPIPCGASATQPNRTLLSRFVQLWGLTQLKCLKELLKCW